MTRKPTTRQIAAYEMRRNGSTWPEIARSLNCTPQTAQGLAKGAERRGMPELPRGKNPTIVTPAAPPGATVALLGAAIEGEGTTLDIARLRQMAEASGMPARLVNGLVHRIQSKWSPVLRELKRFSNETRAGNLLDKADMAAEYIDDAALAAASAKDLASVVGILIDKAQLLRGQPTAIYDINQRRKLNELIPQLYAEARRRGLTIEGEFHVVDGRRIREGDGALGGAVTRVEGDDVAATTEPVDEGGRRG